jgi:hypothetical protein
VVSLAVSLFWFEEKSSKMGSHHFNFASTRETQLSNRAATKRNSRPFASALVAAEAAPSAAFAPRICLHQLLTRKL